MSTENKGGPLALVIAKRDNLAVAIPPALRAGMDVQRIIQGLHLAVQKDPKLAACTPASLYEAALTALQMGLDPSGIGGEAYLVPFGGKATLLPGWRGVAKLARSSGTLRSGGIVTGAVYASDEFAFGEDLTGPIFRHIPTFRGDPGELLGYYALLRFRDGSTDQEFLTASEAAGIAQRAQEKKESPAYRDYADEMGRKTVLKRLLKRQDLSPALRDLEMMEASAEIRLPVSPLPSREPAGQRYLSSRPAPEADDDFEEELDSEDAPLPPPAAPPPQEPTQRKPASTVAVPTQTLPIHRTPPVVRPAAPPTVQRPSSMVGSSPRDGGVSEAREEIQVLIDDLEGAAAGVLSNFQVDMDAGGVAAIPESRLKPLLGALKRLAVEEGVRS